jgi:ribA/ribD-fused uncharacterized protein
VRDVTSNPAALNTSGAVVWFDDFESPNRYRFLSNFYEGDPIHFAVNYVFDDEKSATPYRTGEHLFAALKARNARDHARVRDAKTPGDAKRLGRQIALRDDWESVKYDAMRLVLRLKFALNRPEAEMLVQTGDALLVEGTHWNDHCWGVDMRRGDPVTARGRNWLGTLLMARRAELRGVEMCGWQPDVRDLVHHVIL